MTAIQQRAEGILPDELWTDIFKQSTKYPKFHEMDIDPYAPIMQDPDPSRPSPWDYEILRNVLKTRRSTVLVCRRWYRTGIHLLWSHLVIWRRQHADDDGHPLIPIGVLDNLLESASYFRYVSRVSLLNIEREENEDRGRDNDDERSLELLAQLLNLQKLQCDITLLPRLDRAVLRNKVSQIYAKLSGIQDAQIPDLSYKDGITCLDITLSGGCALDFHEQRLSQLRTLRVSCEDYSFKKSSLGNSITTPKLENLYIRGFSEQWGANSLPKESFGSLRVLEVTQISEDDFYFHSNPPDVVLHLPVLHTLRVSIPTPIQLDSMECPRLQKFQLTRPFDDMASTAYTTITDALNRFPSITNVTIYHDQFSSDMPVIELFSSRTAPTNDTLSLWQSKGVSVLFDPPLLPSTHAQDRLLCVAQAFTEGGPADYLYYTYLEVEGPSRSALWQALCMMDCDSTGWTKSYPSKEEARDAAAEIMIQLLTARLQAEKARKAESRNAVDSEEETGEGDADYSGEE